ncbi:MAG: hypothetical protein ABI899_12855 [Actinomycetota bacterium]
MARMATRIASGLAAAGIASILSMAPAQAMVLPDPPACGTSGCIAPAHPTPEATPWLKIALGAAGGVAVAGAGAATVSSRNRRQQHTPASRTPVAG